MISRICFCVLVLCQLLGWDDDDCFYYHSWRNKVVIAFGTLSSLGLENPRQKGRKKERKSFIDGRNELYSLMACLPILLTVEYRDAAAALRKTVT